jgi:hypothetical protein
MPKPFKTSRYPDQGDFLCVYHGFAAMKDAARCRETPSFNVSGFLIAFFYET